MFRGYTWPVIGNPISAGRTARTEGPGRFLVLMEFNMERVCIHAHNHIYIYGFACVNTYSSLSNSERGTSNVSIRFKSNWKSENYFRFFSYIRFFYVFGTFTLPSTCCYLSPRVARRRIPVAYTTRPITGVHKSCNASPAERLARDACDWNAKKKKSELLSMSVESNTVGRRTTKFFELEFWELSVGYAVSLKITNGPIRHNDYEPDKLPSRNDGETDNAFNSFTSYQH